MAEHNEVGKMGEDYAARYLEEHGYVILHRNWRSKSGVELDIVARQGDELVIVEVKTRKTPYYGSPYLAVDSRKMMNIMRAAESYLECFLLFDCVRFDVIALIGKEPPYQIQHIQEAFDPRLMS